MLSKKTKNWCLQIKYTTVWAKKLAIILNQNFCLNGTTIFSPLYVVFPEKQLTNFTIRRQNTRPRNVFGVSHQKKQISQPKQMPSKRLHSCKSRYFSTRPKKPMTSRVFGHQHSTSPFSPAPQFKAQSLREQLNELL